MPTNTQPFIVACVVDGWLNQPHLVGSDRTLGLGEAAHLLQQVRPTPTQGEIYRLAARSNGSRRVIALKP